MNVGAVVVGMIIEAHFAQRNRVTTFTHLEIGFTLPVSWHLHSSIGMLLSSGFGSFVSASPSPLTSPEWTLPI